MITIGNTIVLEVVEENNQIRKYKSQISDINETDKYAIIDMPIDYENEQFIFLKKDVNYKAYVYGKGNACFSFITQVQSFERKNILVFKIFYPGKESLTREQNRQFARVEAETDVAIYPLNGQAPFVAVSEDISAGGVAVNVSGPIDIESGVIADVWVALKYRNQLIEYVNVKGIVRRIIEKNRNEKIIAFEFCEMDDKERQMLIKYALEQEMLNRNKINSSR